MSVLRTIVPALASMALQAGVARADETAVFVDVTSTHVPTAPELHILDVEYADVDGDGDLDVLAAVEWGPNRLYLNDGAGRFSWVEGAFNADDNDSEDLHIADFNNDGAVDVLFVAEDGEAHEFYLGQGDGGFVDASDRLPVKRSEANAVEAADLDGDGRPEVLIGNNGAEGANFLWRYDDESHRFVDVSATLPGVNDRTQDLEFGDVDGDGDLDLAVANEGSGPRLLLNDGTGALEEASDRLTLSPALISRETTLFDADGDGDLDLLFCNVRDDRVFENADPQTRLLINDGAGRFADETADRLPRHTFSAFDCGAMDVDRDGDLDLLLGAVAQPGFTPLPGAAWRNEGRGVFVEATAEILPESAVGRLWDFEVADLNGDGLDDVFIGGWRSQARLLLGRRSEDQAPR